MAADPEAAFDLGYRVRAWDFLFYASFGVVVASSVRIAGVLLVFAYLIVPALVGVTLARDVRTRTFGATLLVGWLLLRRAARRPGAAAGARLVLVALLLAACEQPPPAPGTAAPARPGPLVIASFDTLAEFTRQIAGGAAEVASLVPAGVEPHDWEPSPQDIARVQRARVFVYNGAGFEPWVDKLLGNLAPEGPAVVDATSRLELRDAELGHRDPHVWLDPVLAQGQVETIRAGLAAADPDNAERYAAGARALTARLAALHAAFEEGLATCARREIVVAHAAFGHLARRYRLTQVPVMGLSPDAEPSPAELARIARFARRSGVTHIFFETLVAPKLAEVLAREVGARTLVLNPVEGLTPKEAAAGKGYVALMEENLRNLRTALDCR